jgi:hypothetical protein
MVTAGDEERGKWTRCGVARTVDARMPPEVAPSRLPARDPYAAPREDPTRGPRRAPGQSLTWLYGTTVVANVVFVLVDRLVVSSPLLDALVTVTRWFGPAVAAAWIHQAWRGIPDTHRGTISPWRAWLSLLIPFYGFYWAIAMNIALCDTLNSIVGKGRLARRAPRTLAIVANALWYVTMVATAAFAARGVQGVLAWLPFALGAIDRGAWFAYMLLCDAARDEVVQLSHMPRGLPAPRLSPLQREPGPRPLPTVAFCAIAFLGFLACWQILQPGERVKDAPSKTNGTPP